MPITARNLPPFFKKRVGHSKTQKKLRAAGRTIVILGPDFGVEDNVARNLATKLLPRPRPKGLTVFSTHAI